MARPRRSCHAVPGSSERFLAKAASLEADELFLDLEDAVAESEKPRARELVIGALREQDFGARTVVVRVNGTDTPHYYRDLIDVVEQAGDRLDALMLPKVRTPGDVEMTDKLLTQIELARERERAVVERRRLVEHAVVLVERPPAPLEPHGRAGGGRAVDRDRPDHLGRLSPARLGRVEFHLDGHGRARGGRAGEEQEHGQEQRTHGSPEGSGAARVPR